MKGYIFDINVDETGLKDWMLRPKRQWVIWYYKGLTFVFGE